MEKKIMSLTRKHYNELAEIIRDNLIEFNSLEGKIIFGDYFKTQLLSFLKRDNRNFKKDLFLEASGLDSPTLEELENTPPYSEQSEHISNSLEEALRHATGSEIGKFGYRA
jgi:hypothetical protein